LADNLGLIIQVNYTSSQKNIDDAIKKLQEHVDTKKLNIAFDTASIKGLDQISKAIAPSINQVNNLNSSMQTLGRTMDNVNKKSVVETKQNGILTEIKEVKELENALGHLVKVTEIINAKSGSRSINEETTNYKKQREAVDALNASKMKMQQSLEPFKLNPALITEVQQLLKSINGLDTSSASKTNVQQIRNQIDTLKELARQIENVRKEEERLAKEQLKQQEQAERNIQRQNQLYAGLFNQTEKSIQQQANLLNTRMQSALGIGVKVNGLSPESSRVLESQLERYKNIIKQFQNKNELGINIRPEQLTQLQNLENRIKRFYETIRQGQNDSHGFNFTQYDQFTRLNPAITNATHAQQYYNTSLLEGHRLIASNIQQTEQYIRVTQQLRNGSQHLNLGVYIDRATGQMYQFNEALRDGMTRSWGLGEAMSTAATKAMVWSVVMGTMYSFLNILQQIPTAIIEINTRLVEMSKVMSSDTDYGVLMDNLSKSANAYGRTITETQNAVIEFGKQGFEAAQATDMANTALLGANVTGLKTAEMAQYLTATMAQFNVVAEDSVSIVNKINEVDNNFAVTSQGLAQSLSKAGESAQIYGATLDDVIGYTTAIQTATKESGNVIGNSLKTTISRTFSTDSEKALAGVGIAIKDISGNVRDVNQIWGELAVKFKTLSSEQKQQIGLTIGSRYHLTRFLALMDNWQIVTDATTTSQRSLFSALEENRKHLGSLESQINKVKSAGQELSYVLGESGLKSVMYGVLSGTTLLINGLTELSNMGAGGTVAITALVVTMGGLLLKTLSLIPALNAATVALKAFTLATLTNPWIIFGTVVLATIVGIVSYFGHAKQVREEQEKLNKTLNDSTKNFNALTESINKVGAPTLQNINDIEAQIKRYDELTEAILKSKEAESKKIVKTIDPRTMQVSLQKKNIPDEVIDLAANLRIDIGAFKTYDKLLSEITKKQRELADSTKKAQDNSTEYQAQQIKLSQTSLDVANNTNDLVNEYKELSSITEKNEQQTKRYSEVKNMLLAMFPEEFKNGKITIALLEEESKKRVELAEKSLGQSRTQLIENAKSTQSAYETAVKNMAMYQAEIDMLNSLWASRSNNAGSTGNWRLSEDLGMAQYNFGETKKEANSLADAISKMNDVLNWKPASVAGIGDDKKESGSSKEKDEKELSIESTTQALINQIEQEYLLQKAKSESIQKDLTQAQSQKDYAKTLSLTNELIASQRTEMELLQSARSKINQLKDSAIATASPQFGNVSDRWFTGSDNQKSASFIEEHNRASEDTRKIMDETFDSLQLLRNAWMSNKSSMEENIATQKEFAKSSREDLIKGIEEQSKTLSDSETSTIESSFKNLDIESWIESNITATSDWADVVAELQEEISKLGTPTTLEGQLKYNSLLKESAKLAADALKAEIAYNKEVEKAKQNALFESTDANLQEIMDKIDAVDQEQQLSQGGISSAVPKIDMEIVPRIDYKSVEDAIAEIPKPNVDEYDFEPPETFVTFIHSQFTNAVLKAKNDVADLTLKINSLGEITPANKTEVLGYYQQIQDALTTLSKTASEAETNLKISLDKGEISKSDFDEKLKTIQVADLEVLAVPKFEMTADAQTSLNTVKEKIGSIDVDANTKPADDKLLALMSKQYDTTLTIIADDIAAKQAIAELQVDTSSIHTIYEVTKKVDSVPTEGFAKGTDSAPGGISIVSEKGPELIQNPDGSIYLSGDNGAELVYLQKGAKVTPHNETEKILKSQGGKIPAYAEGTGSHITDMDFLKSSATEFSEAITDLTKVITKSSKLVDSDNKAVEKSNKKMDKFQATIDKYSGSEYTGSRSAERKVESAQRGLDKETSKNEQLVKKADLDKSILDSQNATKTDYTQKLIATQKALANLNSAQYIEQKIDLYQEAITVASTNIDKLYESIAKYKNDDGTYQDNTTTRDVLGKIKSYFEAGKSAQLSIKQLVKERFEAEYEGYEKVQKLEENRIAYLQKTLDYQKLIGASIEDQLATEEEILKTKNSEQSSLKLEKIKAERDQKNAKNKVKSDLALVDPNYTEADLNNALANSEEYQLASDKLDDVNSKLLDTKIAIAQTVQDIANLDLEKELRPMTNNLEKLDLAEKLLDDDLQGKLDIAKDKLKTFVNEQSELQDQIDNIDTYHPEMDDQQKVTFIASLKDRLGEVKVNAKDIQDVIAQTYTDIANLEVETLLKPMTDSLSDLDFAGKLINEDDLDGKLDNAKLKLKNFADEQVILQNQIDNVDTLHPKMSAEDKKTFVDGLKKEIEDAKIGAKEVQDSIVQTVQEVANLNLDKALKPMVDELSDLDLAEKLLNEDDLQGKLDIAKKKLKQFVNEQTELQYQIDNVDTLHPGMDNKAKEAFVEDLKKKLTDAKVSAKEIQDIINQTVKDIENLDFENLLKPFKDVISNLEVLLKLLDENDFAGSIENIGNQMEAEASIIANIKQKIAETIADTSLTAKEKSDRLEKYSNDLNEAELAMKGLIDAEEDFEKKTLAKAFKTQYESIEKTIFNGSTEQDAQDALNQRIALQDKYLDGAEKDLEIGKIRTQIQSEGLTLTSEQTDLLNTQGKIEQSSIERLQKQLDIQQLQLKVSNLMEQKTIQQLTKNADGTYDFTYVTDQTAINQVQEDLVNKRIELIKFEKNQVNIADQNALSEKSKYLAKVKAITDRAQNGEYASMEEFTNAMSTLNQEYLGGMDLVNSTEWNNIYNTTQTSLGNISTAYFTYVGNMEALAIRSKQAYRDILNSQTVVSQSDASSAQQTRASSSFESQQAEFNANNANGNIPTVNVNKVWNIGYASAHSSTPNIKVTDNQGNVVPVTVARTNDSNFSVTPLQSYANGQDYTLSYDGNIQKFKASVTGSYKDGGVIDYQGLAQVHGSSSSSEVAFNSSQAKKLYDLVKSIPNGFDLSKIPVVSAMSGFKPMDVAKNLISKTNQTINHTFNIDRLEFPNVTSSDGLEEAFNNLPLKAAQHAKIQYGQ